MTTEVNIVIPVYNNAPTLRDLYDGIDRIVSGLTLQYHFEVVFVNDGSTDGSAEVINNLPQGEYLHSVCIEMPRNCGQVQAVLAGLKACSGTGPSIIMSADLQDPPDVIGKLLNAWSGEKDLVIAARTTSLSVPSEWFHRIIHLFYREYPVTGFDVALLDASLRKKMAVQATRPQFLQIEMLKASTNTGMIRYEKQVRKMGRSQWSLAKRLQYLFTFLRYYTRLPLLLVLIVLAFIAILTLIAFL